MFENGVDDPIAPCMSLAVPSTTLQAMLQLNMYSGASIANCDSGIEPGPSKIGTEFVATTTMSSRCCRAFELSVSSRHD